MNKLTKIALAAAPALALAVIQAPAVLASVQWR